jgi:hypothetical protein
MTPTEWSAAAAAVVGVQANVSFDGMAPASLFQNADVSGEHDVFGHA